MPDQPLKKILITGASGFVGSRFFKENSEKYRLEAVSLQNTPINEIDWEGVSVVLHMAGIAHRMEPTPDELYYNVNHKLTSELAQAAKNSGVEHFIYMSSAKVYGDNYAYVDLNTPCEPDDAYGDSKLKAEQTLKSLETDAFRVAVVRPPLVYGKGVKGNMANLINLCKKKLPLPFGRINNRRSMVHLLNLIHLINLIIAQKASGTFLVQDAQPISTSGLVGSIQRGLFGQPRRLSIPGPLRSLLKKVSAEKYKRLFGSFEVDDKVSINVLGYTPVIIFDDGIKEMLN